MSTTLHSDSDVNSSKTFLTQQQHWLKKLQRGKRISQWNGIHKLLIHLNTGTSTDMAKSRAYTIINNQNSIHSYTLGCTGRWSYRFCRCCLTPDPDRHYLSHKDSLCTGEWRAPPSPGVCRSPWSGHFPSCSGQLPWQFSIKNNQQKQLWTHEI